MEYHRCPARLRRRGGQALNSYPTPSVGVTAIGKYIPQGVLTSRDLAKRSGFPEYVFAEKIGLRQKPIAGPEEHPSDLGVKAAADALRRARVSPEQIDL